MNVLVVSHHAPPHIGGLENLVHTEVCALLDAGHVVTWMTSDLGGAGTPVVPHERLRLIRVRAWHVIERRFSVAFPLFSPALAVVLWREMKAADVIHVHGFVFMSTTAATLIAKVRRVPVILTDHGGVLHYRSRLATWLLRAAIETVGRLNVRLSRRRVAYNCRVHRLLARLAGNERRSQFLPNPVDHDLFRPPTAQQRRDARAELDWPEDRMKILFVGRIVADKGVDVLLGASDPGYDLVFCGPATEAMRQRLARCEAEHLSPRPQSELIRVYWAADLFVLPSWNEGFPVVIQEALACGLPVLTSDDEGYDAYRCMTGLRFCSPTAESVRDTITQILSERLHVQPDEIAEGARTMFPDRSEWLGELLKGIASTRGNGTPEHGE